MFNQSFDEDYYEPIKTIGSFDNKNNCIGYESKGDKDKKLSLKKYLNLIRPYLNDITNDHKAHEGWDHSDNKVIDCKTTLSITHKDSNETCTMHTKSDNIEIMISHETDEITEELFKFPL